MRTDESKRMLTVAIVTVMCVLVSVFTTISLLYNTSYNLQLKQMALFLKSEKSLIEAVGRFDAVNSQADHDGGALGGTLSQLVDAHRQYVFSMESADYLLVQNTENQTEVVVRHMGNDVLVTDRYELDGQPLKIPDWGAGILSQVVSQGTGSINSDGAIVVYESFQISDASFHLLLRVSLSELRAPFVFTAGLTLLIALLLIIAGVRYITREFNHYIKLFHGQIEFNEMLLECAATPIIVTDQQGEMTSVNSATCSVFGYTTNRLLGHNIEMLITDESFGLKTECIGTHSNGNQLNFQVSTGQLVHEGKDVHIHILDNITERIETEVALKENMAQTSAVIDTVQDSILMLNNHGEVLNSNPATEKLFGYSAGELQGVLITRILPTSKINKGPLTAIQLLGSSEAVGGESTENEHTFAEIDGRHKDGFFMPLNVSLTCFAVGEKQYFTVVARDISERKQSEIELMLHRNNLEQMVQNATNEIKAIVHTAVNGVMTIDEQGVIHIFNEAAEDMFGWASHEIIGKNAATLLPVVAGQPFSDFLQQYLADSDAPGINKSIEVSGARRDNSVFPAQLAIGHKQLSAGRHLFVAFISDITQQKEFERELVIAKNNAEAAARVKASFLANMSHEIRTPMNAIIGFSEILSQDDTIQASSQEFITTILNSGKNLLNIINDILDFSKIEAGQIHLEQVAFNLPNALKDMLKTLEFKAAEKDLALALDVSSNVPKRIVSDPTRLRQVVINLMNNAIKFTNSGRVCLRVNLDARAGKLLFEVKDTGIGMTPEQQASVFDAFSQADASTNRRFGGTGLGTTISKQIVELMGGEIWVESQVDVGSCFSFTIDLIEAGHDDDCLFEDGIVTNNRYFSPRIFNVLLAEDIEANAVLATLRLKQQGHAVTWAKNGREAVDQVQASTFDVVLMDIQMPVMDGLTATRVIRDLEKGSDEHLTIIALTASIMKEEQQQCFDAGVDGIVGKPIDFAELFTSMEAIVCESKGKAGAGLVPLEPVDKTQIDFSCVESLIDVEQALGTWLDALIYGKALKDFVRQHGNDVGNILVELRKEEPDREMICGLAHALKGLAGNLFITSVQQLADQVDQAIKAQRLEEATSIVEQLYQEVERVCKAIDQLTVQQTVKKRHHIEFDRTNVKQILSELQQSLRSLNPDSVMPHLSELSAYIDAELIAGIQSHVDNFDFDSASAQVVAIAERFDLYLSEPS